MRPLPWLLRKWVVKKWQQLLFKKLFPPLYIWPRMACGILGPPPGIEPMPPTSGSVVSQQLDHQESPSNYSYCYVNIVFTLCREQMEGMFKHLATEV